MKKISHLLLIMISLLTGSVNLSAQKVSSMTSLPAKPVVYTLQGAISAACQNNAELHKTRLSTQSMQELKSELYTKYFPHISASGTYFERSRGLAEGSEYLDALFNLIDNVEEPQVEGVQILKRGFLGSMTAIQPIYTGGRLTAANKLAQLGAEATREKMAIQQDQLTQEVEKYFWQLVQLYEAERSLQTMDSLIERANHDASTALKAGLVTKGDKMQVDIYASKIEGMHLQVANGKELCKEYLAYLLGAERVDSIQWEDIYLRKKPEEYFADPNAVIVGRHETQLLQIQLSAAKLKKKFTLGSMLPSVGAAFSFNYHYFLAKNDKGTYHSFFDKKSTAWMAAAHVSIPISGWWGGKHALRRADIGIEKAQIDVDDKRKLMLIQISQKWKVLNEKYKQVDIALRQLQQSEQNQKQQASAYRSGAITMTNRLQADALYQESRTQYIDACIKYKLAITDYLHATGR